MLPTPHPQVDKQLRDMVRRARERPNALACCTQPAWLQAFRKCSETLEAVQRSLEDYLEAKRVAFPRWG
jgi:dynein heavy chain